MFDGRVVSEIAKQSQGTLNNLRKIEERLNERFFDMEEAVRALVLSVASGEPLLFIGPPGTAKSRLIRAFCHMLGLIDLDHPEIGHEGYFEYLITPFTEPNELFGYFNVEEAMKGSIQRIESNMMHRAKVVYLDEIFNGSSAILNSILAFLNERIFHDRGERKKVAMQALFASTNRVPDAPELRAVFDRFVLRCWVFDSAAEPEKLRNLLTKGWQETYTSHAREPKFPSLLTDLVGFHGQIRELAESRLSPQRVDDQVFRRFVQIVNDARRHDLSGMSNRRLVKMLYVMLVHRVYDAVCKGQVNMNLSLRDEENALICRYFLDRHDEELERKLCQPG